MTALLAAERIKLLSTRSAWWCALFAVCYALGSGDFRTLTVAPRRVAAGSAW